MHSRLWFLIHFFFPLLFHFKSASVWDSPLHVFFLLFISPHAFLLVSLSHERAWSLYTYFLLSSCFWKSPLCVRGRNLTKWVTEGSLNLLLVKREKPWTFSKPSITPKFSLHTSLFSVGLYLLTHCSFPSHPSFFMNPCVDSPAVDPDEKGLLWGALVLCSYKEWMWEMFVRVFWGLRSVSLKKQNGRRARATPK